MPSPGRYIGGAGIHAPPTTVSYILFERSSSITTRLCGRLKGSLFLEVEPDVSCDRCKRRPATYYGPAGCAGIDQGCGGFPGRRTGCLPPALCSVVLSTRTARLGGGLSARTAHG